MSPIRCPRTKRVARLIDEPRLVVEVEDNASSSTGGFCGSQVKPTSSRSCSEPDSCTRALQLVPGRRPPANCYGGQPRPFPTFGHPLHPDSTEGPKHQRMVFEFHIDRQLLSTYHVSHV